jgi:large subunit ribosomal protein L16
MLRAKRINIKQLEATRRIISRSLKGKNRRLWVRCCPNVPITKKPQQVRMGKGKGTFDSWVYKIKAGKILFEVNFFSASKARKLLRQAILKLGARAIIVRRRPMIHKFQML